MRTVGMLVALAVIGVGSSALLAPRSDNPTRAGDLGATRLAQVGPLATPPVNPGRLGPRGDHVDPAEVTGGRDAVVPGNPAGRLGTIDEGRVGTPPVNAMPGAPIGAVPPPPAGAVAPPAGGRALGAPPAGAVGPGPAGAPGPPPVGAVGR